MLAAGESQYFSLLVSFSRLLGLVELRTFSSTYQTCYWRHIEASAITLAACYTGVSTDAVQQWLQSVSVQ